MSEDLPDAPWATAPSGGDLPEAPWAAQSQTPPVSTAADVAKSAGSGLTQGAVGVAAAGPLLANTIARGAAWLAEQTGYDPTKAISPGGGLAEGVKQAEANRLAIEQARGGKPFFDYEPQTTAGKYTKTAAEFIPAVAAANPTADVAALGRVIPKYAIGPGIASEAAGQAAEGTPFEGPARVAAAVLGQRGAYRATAPRAPKLPTHEELHEAVDNSFNNLRGYGVEFKQRSVNKVADDAANELDAKGWDKSNAPKTMAAIEKLRNPEGENVTFNDLERFRRALGNAGWEERAASSVARSHLNDFYTRLAPRDAAVNGHFIPRIKPELNEALANSHVEHKLRDLSEIRIAGEDATRPTNDAILASYRRILKSKEARRAYTPEQQAQMRRAVRGTVTGNVAHALSYLAPSHPFTGLSPAAVAYALGAGLHSLALPAAGIAGSAVSKLSTGRQIRALERMVAAQSPLAKARQSAHQEQLSSTSKPRSIQWAPDEPEMFAHEQETPGGKTTYRTSDPNWRPPGTTNLPVPYATGGVISHKLSHAEVDYNVGHKMRPDRCATCQHYMRGSPPHCHLVADPIRPNDWCERYVQKNNVR